VKSGGGGEVTTKNTCAKWESLPLDPVRFMLKVPVGAEAGTSTVNVELPVPVSKETEFGFTATVAPTLEGMVAFRFTLPAKPKRLESFIVKVATDPGLMVREGGVNATLKSGPFESAFRVP